LDRWLTLTYAPARSDAEETERRALRGLLAGAGVAVERDPSPHPLDGDADRMWPLGPAVRPGEVVSWCVHSPSDHHAETVVLAVAQNAERRIPFVRFGSDPWFGEGEHLGRMAWTRRLGQRGWSWGVTHAHPWEGPGTLGEVLAGVVEIHGPMEVLR
jgi:hypothetical protein